MSKNLDAPGNASLNFSFRYMIIPANCLNPRIMPLIISFILRFIKSIFDFTKSPKALFNSSIAGAAVPDMVCPRASIIRFVSDKFVVNSLAFFNLSSSTMTGKSRAMD